MTRVSPAPTNPLAAAARSVPLRTAELVLLGTKAAGIAALLALFVDQSYDGTRGFTLGVSLVVAASLVPLRGVPGVLAAAAGAGLLFFAGATLTYYAAGVVALVCGLLASLAVLSIATHRGTTPWAAAGFLAGAPLTAFVAVLVIALTQR